MSKTKPKRITLFAALLLAVALIATLFAACNKDGRAKDEFVIGTSAVITSADRSDYNFDQLSAGLTQQALVARNTDGTYSPLLAEFSESEDGGDITFTVREGMSWDDGVPVTAEDILFTLNYVDAHESGNWLRDVTDTAGVITPSKLLSADTSEDGRSITFRYREADVRALADLTSVRVMPRHIYEGKTVETASAAENRVGCGVYRFESYSREAGTITFLPNEHYPAEGELAVKRVTVRLFSSDSALQLAMRNGELDTVWKYSGGAEPAFAEKLRSEGKAEVIAVATDNLPAVLAFNTSSSPFDDADLRKAVVYAIDYARFGALFASASAQTPHAGFVPPTTLGYTADTPTLARDPDLARAHLQAGLARKGWSSLSFTLSVNADNELHVSYAKTLKLQLEEVGIGVDIKAMTKNDFQASTTNSGGNVTHQACIIGYTSNGMKMMGGLGTIYMDGTHPVQGVSQVFDEDFDGILDKLSSASTSEEYAAAAAECQNWYAENFPAVALFWDAQLQVVSPGWTGFVTDADFGIVNMRIWQTLRRA